MTASPELIPILDAIRKHPEGKAQWMALASWLWDNGRDDEAAIVRTYWTTLRDNVTAGGVTLDETLRQVANHANRLGERAREMVVRRDGGSLGR